MNIGAIEINGFRVDAGGPPWFQAMLALCLISAFFLSIAWVWGDAEQRGKSGCLAQVFLLLTWPVSLLWWLWLRPPLKPPAPPPLPKDP